MTKVKLTGLLMALVLAVFSTLPLHAEEATPRTYVVLVGVSQYADPQITPRPHAEDDAKAFYDVLTDKKYLGVDGDHVRLLLGSADNKRHSEPATHQNIVKAVHWVASKAQPDDLVIFAYIGQGAPLSVGGEKMCYLAADSTLKNRAKDAVAAADLQQELDKLKSQRFCAFIDVNFHGFKDGPEKLPEPALASGSYREFLGDAGKEEHSSAMGRAVFLANSGLAQSPNMQKNGVFTHVLVNGLKGAADKDGYEPDGVVTVDELGKYLEDESPDLIRTYAKTDEDKRQAARFFESRGAHFVLTHNPAVAAKVEERLEKLGQLAKGDKLSSELAAEGRKLLLRMPKLKAHQDLRRSYQLLVDGKLTLDDFTKQRSEALSAQKLRRSEAFAYAAKVIQSTQIIRENYVKEVSQGDLVAWAVRGLYRQIEEKLPAEVRERLDKAKELSEAELTALLADIRERLGQREDLEHHKDVDISLQRMLAHLDPYTTYFDPETVARFQQETSGNFKGIGIQIRENRSEGMLQVVTPLKDSPAYQAGLKAGDLVSSITLTTDKDGKPLAEPEVISTKGMTTNDAVKKIQGKPGTKVRLTVIRKGASKPLEFEVKRSVIEIETVLGIQRKDNDEWNFYVDPTSKIAYVRVTTFARRTARDLQKVLTKLQKQGMNGIILDLRFNPGGLLTSAVEISDMFIDDGLIVTIKPRAGREVSYPGEHEGSFLNFPMVCLVNGMSASGSEIVSACLQDHERAVIMGERSYGKGSVQNIQPFEGGELKFTTASFWRPNGKNLNKSSTTGKDDEDWGVRPNKGYVLPLTEKESQQLYEHMHDSEIIPNRDLPPDATKKSDFKDKQLEMALEYLRSQIRTATKVTKRPG